MKSEEEKTHEVIDLTIRALQCVQRCLPGLAADRATMVRVGVQMGCRVILSAVEQAKASLPSSESDGGRRGRYTH